jgi:hypothetical protein
LVIPTFPDMSGRTGATRGWLEKKDVLNTWTLGQLQRWLDKK